jgi:hypothetical protein
MDQLERARELAAAEEKVRLWMLANPRGTPGQMAGELKRGYPEQFQADMVIVLRSFMARFKDHPEELADPGPAAGCLRETAGPAGVVPR